MSMSAVNNAHVRDYYPTALQDSTYIIANGRRSIASGPVKVVASPTYASWT